VTPILTILLVCLGGLWYLDRRRVRADHLRFRKQIGELREEQRMFSDQEQARQRTLFDGMVEGVLLVDERGTIQFLNLALKRLFGLVTDVRGQPLNPALAGPALWELFQRVQADGQMVGQELDLSTTVGRVLQVNASLFSGAEGSGRRTLFVFHDLTRLKQFEESRRDFVANVSHELRTPLTLIKGFVHTLIDGGAESPAQALGYLHTIAKHTDRLTFLIEDLLTLARLESGGAVINPQPVRLREVTEHVLADLGPRAEGRGVTLANDVPETLGAKADADRLEQVLLNLVENAIKHGREQGRVTVGGRSVAGHRIELWVRDDGPGIPPESRDRVFERFYRVDRARTRDKGGTGLGLSIVKHIINAHGGQVWVQSEVGRGSTFFITLPKASVLGGTDAEEASPRPATARGLSASPSRAPSTPVR
jgi:two-component system phosphate regulon sensor histidine kinase PhoR